MTSEQLEERKRQNLRRRIMAMRDAINPELVLSQRDLPKLVDRLMKATRQEGINDVDLRVMVRMFLRETAG